MLTGSITPDLTYQVRELPIVIRETGSSHRAGAHDDGACAHQVANAAHCRKRQAMGAGIEGQHAIDHAAARNEVAVLHGKLIEKRVSIDEVEVVTLWNLRRA